MARGVRRQKSHGKIEKPNLFQKGNKPKWTAESRKKLSDSMRKSFDTMYWLREFEAYPLDKFQKQVELAKGEKKGELTVGKFIAMKATSLKMKGDYRFFKDSLDRQHGTATQKVEHSGEMTSNLNVNLADNIQKRLNEANSN